jgi:hypothetical protein
MKKIIATIFLGSIAFANAQVIIGDAVGTAAVKTSVLLEFAANQNKGLILPYVRTKSLTPTEGTILLDASEPSGTPGTQARVKYYAGSVKGWVDLSGQDANLNSTNVLANFATEQPSTITETATSKAIIGAQTTAADGVLVLESTTKAMVLPTVADVQNIPSPSPGMMVYINKTGAKRLAVYNGSKWSFWKP